MGRALRRMRRFPETRDGLLEAGGTVLMSLYYVIINKETRRSNEDPLCSGTEVGLFQEIEASFEPDTTGMR
jgi:hypothetical protein